MNLDNTQIGQNGKVDYTKSMSIIDYSFVIVCVLGIIITIAL